MPPQLHGKDMPLLLTQYYNIATVFLETEWERSGLGVEASTGRVKSCIPLEGCDDLSKTELDGTYSHMGGILNLLTCPLLNESEFDRSTYDNTRTRFSLFAYKLVHYLAFMYLIAMNDRGKKKKSPNKIYI